MNEPIMRRGLSPEGKKIRQRHQGSLLNYEHGVTSIPLHRKIEKDFVKENVMRLREIQAKCRTQEMKSNLGMQPVKALRGNTNILPIVGTAERIVGVEAKEKGANSISENPRDRRGSAHSDYFSLSDEVAIEPLELLLPSDKEIKSELNSKSTDTEKHDRECQVDLLPVNPKAPLQIRSKSANSNYMFPYSSPTPPLCFQETKLLPNSKHSTSRQLGDLYPHSLYMPGTKVSNMLERLKCKKPACDTNASFIWRDIHKNHKELFSAQDEHQSRRSIAPESISNVRSRSLDRRLIDRTNIVHPSNLPRTTSKSDDNISTASEKSHISSSTQTCPVEPVQIELPNNNCTKESLLETSSRLSGSLPVLTQESLSGTNVSKTYLKANNNIIALKSEADVRFSPRSCQQPEFGATYTKEKSDINASSTPVLSKKDPSLLIYRQNALARQRSTFLRSKSSSNLHMVGEPPPTYKRGQVPKYLQVRKAQNQKQQEALAAIDPNCPPGHVSLPDHERITTLHLLKKGQIDVLQQLSGLPVAQDTLRVKKLKQDLESKLNQIEEGIQIFSQTKVYVVNDE